MLRPGIVGMRGSMGMQLRPSMTIVPPRLRPSALGPYPMLVRCRLQITITPPAPETRRCYTAVPVPCRTGQPSYVCLIVCTCQASTWKVRLETYRRIRNSYCWKSLISLSQPAAQTQPKPAFPSLINGTFATYQILYYVGLENI